MGGWAAPVVVAERSVIAIRGWMVVVVAVAAVG
jgi:hypothetical protein